VIWMKSDPFPKILLDCCCFCRLTKSEVTLFRGFERSVKKT
jgi:hypothetical protein